jgi:hypothetical protein
MIRPPAHGLVVAGLTRIISAEIAELGFQISALRLFAMPGFELD